MSSIDSTIPRSNFFPNSRTTQSGRSKKLNAPYMQRNSDGRKSALDRLAKRDTRVDISNQVKDFARIKKAVDQAPQIDNSDKIAQLKQQIEAGTYQVNYDALADKILASEY